MTKYTSKPHTVDAVRYDAPTSTDDDGNIAEIAAFGIGLQLLNQSPWNPADGQSCLQVVIPAEEGYEPTYLGLLVPGGYLAVDEHGAISMWHGADFEAAYDVPTESAAQTPADAQTGEQPK